MSRPSREVNDCVHRILRPSLDEITYLVVDDSVADDDNGAGHVMPDNRHGNDEHCHGDDEHRVLVW